MINLGDYNLLTPVILTIFYTDTNIILCAYKNNIDTYTNEKPQENLPKARFIYRPRFEPNLLLNHSSKIHNSEKARYLLAPSSL